MPGGASDEAALPSDEGFEVLDSTTDPWFDTAGSVASCALPEDKDAALASVSPGGTRPGGICAED